MRGREYNGCGEDYNVETRLRASNIICSIILRLLGRISSREYGKGTKISGEKINIFKNVVGEEYQVVGNFIHPCWWGVAGPGPICGSILNWISGWITMAPEQSTRWYFRSGYLVQPGIKNPGSTPPPRNPVVYFWVVSFFVFFWGGGIFLSFLDLILQSKLIRRCLRWTSVQQSRKTKTNWP